MAFKVNTPQSGQHDVLVDSRFKYIVQRILSFLRCNMFACWWINLIIQKARPGIGPSDLGNMGRGRQVLNDQHAYLHYGTYMKFHCEQWWYNGGKVILTFSPYWYSTTFGKSSMSQNQNWSNH
jgi:hypothetical protein